MFDIGNERRGGLEDLSLAKGHGHVVPRADGARARCGGPALCGVCRSEQAAQCGTAGAPTGWLCPQCNTPNSPAQPVCFSCSAPVSAAAVAIGRRV